MYIRNKMKFLPQKYETQLHDHWTFYQRRIPYLKVNPVLSHLCIWALFEREKFEKKVITIYRWN